MFRRGTVKEKTPYILDLKLSKMELYSVISIVDKNVRYVADYERFGMIKDGEMITCDLDEIPILADMCTPLIKQEILDVYNDLKDLIRMNVKYAFRYKGERVDKEEI